ncbi:MAG: hypothetical protein AAGE18_01820 [Pseudomonadota bacterium]
MADFQVGDLVVLTCGSMRMAVEGVDEAGVACLWCHEGVIGRDRFDARLLRKWEHREPDGDDRRPKGGKSFGGDRAGGGRKYAGNTDKPKPKPKTGWDGKPREKTYFRKDG